MWGWGRKSEKDERGRQRDMMRREKTPSRGGARGGTKCQRNIFIL